MTTLNLFFLRNFNNVGYCTSPDGVTWTARTGTADDLSALLNETTLLGTRRSATSPPGVYSSTDGINWTQRSTSVACFANVIARGGSRLVATSTTISAGGGTVYSSIYSDNDGLTWSAGAPINQCIGSVIAHNGSFFVAVSSMYVNNDLETYSRKSTDGITWTQGTSRVNAPSAFITAISNLFWNGSVFVALIGGLGASGSAFEVNARIFTSTDGLAWTVQSTSAVLLSKGSPSFHQPVFVDGVWHIAFYEGGTARSTDGGITWQAPTTVPGSFLPKCVAGYIGKLIAVGADAAFQSVDKGITWTALTPTGLTSFNGNLLSWVGALGSGADLILPRLAGVATTYGHGSAAYPLFPLYAVPAPPAPSFWTRRTRSRERA